MIPLPGIINLNLDQQRYHSIIRSINSTDDSSANNITTAMGVFYLIIILSIIQMHHSNQLFYL